MKKFIPKNLTIAKLQDSYDPSSMIAHIWDFEISSEYLPQT